MHSSKRIKDLLGTEFDLCGVAYSYKGMLVICWRKAYKIRIVKHDSMTKHFFIRKNHKSYYTYCKKHWNMLRKGIPHRNGFKVI